MLPQRSRSKGLSLSPAPLSSYIKPPSKVLFQSDSSAQESEFLDILDWADNVLIDSTANPSTRTTSSSGFGTTTSDRVRNYEIEFQRPNHEPGNYLADIDGDSARKTVLVDLLWTNLGKFPSTETSSEFSGIRARTEWTIVALERVVCIITATAPVAIQRQLTAFLQAAAALRQEVGNVGKIVDEYHYAASTDRVRLDLAFAADVTTCIDKEEELLCSASVGKGAVDRDEPSKGYTIDRVNVLLQKLSRYLTSLLTWTPKPHFIQGEETNLRRFLKNFEYLRLRLGNETAHLTTLLQASYIDNIGEMFVSTQAAQRAIDTLKANLETMKGNIRMTQKSVATTDTDNDKLETSRHKCLHRLHKNLFGVQASVNEAQENVDKIQKGMKAQQQIMVRAWSERRKEFCA